MGWGAGDAHTAKGDARPSLPALAPDTALEMALLEMARFLFMISSNSTSLTGGGGGPSSRLCGRQKQGGGG